MRGTTWPLIGLLAWATCWLAASPCGAQSTSSTPAPPPVSSVSPAIARYMNRVGKTPTPASATPGPDGSPGLARLTASPFDSKLKRASQLPPPLPGTNVAPLPAVAASPETGVNPLAVDLRLKVAPTTTSDLRFPINLATALRLSDARPLVVAAAQAGVWAAEADLTRAKVVWVPTFNLGADLIHHDGGGPDFNKGVMTTPASVNFLYAGGGLTGSVNLTDALFLPLAARQVLNAKHWDVQTAKNDVLLQTANTYFNVHQARGTYAGALYAVERGRDLVERIASLSGELVPKVEVDRARNALAELEQRASQARQDWRVQSANLTQVLRLDPRSIVEPMEHDHAQITLIDPGRPFENLMPIALTNRPELASNQALVQAAEIGIRREKNRPLLPTFLLNGFQTPGQDIQGGIFGLGPNSTLNQYVGRADVSIQAVWQLEGLGLGNLARIKAQRGQESQAIINLRKTQDRVAGEVNRATANVQSASARVLQADRALRTAIITFNGHFEGLGQTRRLENVLVLSYRPQEAVYSLVLLNVAFNEYFATVADYNRAQFELFHALGYPANEVAALRPTGQVVPVNLARPSYLPPVGNGPPPATR